MTKEYPLQWPQGWPRARLRKPGAFRSPHSTQAGTITYHQAEHRVVYELAKLGLRSDRQGHVIVISTNMIRDREPADPGAAVYFQKPGGPMRVIAIDIYSQVAHNVAAIAATLEAMRAIDRHGGAQIMERAFTGFDALPPPMNWRNVLGLIGHPTPEEISARYNLLAKERHPDKGGSAAAFDELTKARAAAGRELGYD